MQRQAAIEQRSEQVMPFSMIEAMHVFTPTAGGGVQQVVVHDGNQEQIRLVRRHLRQQAHAFAHGDFANPAYVHGNDMPGLTELERDYRRIRISYANIALGGKITYASTDHAAVTAIHQWFAAQVRDHGEHAQMGGM